MTPYRDPAESLHAEIRRLQADNERLRARLAFVLGGWKRPAGRALRFVRHLLLPILAIACGKPCAEALLQWGPDHDRLAGFGLSLLIMTIVWVCVDAFEKIQRQP